MRKKGWGRVTGSSRFTETMLQKCQQLTCSLNDASGAWLACSSFQRGTVLLRRDLHPLVSTIDTQHASCAALQA